MTLFKLSIVCVFIVFLHNPIYAETQVEQLPLCKNQHDAIRTLDEISALLAHGEKLKKSNFCQEMPGQYVLVSEEYTTVLIKLTGTLYGRVKKVQLQHITTHEIHTWYVAVAGTII